MKLLRSIDLFTCASQASTSILHTTTTTMDLQQPSSSSSSTSAHLGGRAIDRHNPIIRETTRRVISTTNINIPCTSNPPPLAPIPYKQLHRSKIEHGLVKTGSKKSVDQKKKSKIEHGRKSGVVEEEVTVRKSSDGRRSSDVVGEFVRKSFGRQQRGDFVINGPDSSRYLLGEAGLLDLVPDFELVSPDDGKTRDGEKGARTEESSSSSASSDCNAPPPPPSSRSPDQEVVLRVSLHCKGCEGKVRKHISRMQGVTSFNIDFAAKKVTVVGDVTPLEVLSSISKVKTAQLWTPPTPSSLPTSSSSFSGIKKSKALAAGR